MERKSQSFISENAGMEMRICYLCGKKAHITSYKLAYHLVSFYFDMLC